MDFYENVAVCNEKVLEAYLEGGSIEEESVREMIQKRELFPCFFGSALKMEGIEELLLALFRIYENAGVSGKVWCNRI